MLRSGARAGVAALPLQIASRTAPLPPYQPSTNLFSQFAKSAEASLASSGPSAPSCAWQSSNTLARQTAAGRTKLLQAPSVQMMPASPSSFLASARNTCVPPGASHGMRALSANASAGEMTLEEQVLAQRKALKDGSDEYASH